MCWSGCEIPRESLEIKDLTEIIKANNRGKHYWNQKKSSARITSETMKGWDSVVA